MAHALYLPIGKEVRHVRHKMLKRIENGFSCLDVLSGEIVIIMDDHYSSSVSECHEEYRTIPAPTSELDTEVQEASVSFDARPSSTDKAIDIILQGIHSGYSLTVFSPDGSKREVNLVLTGHDNNCLLFGGEKCSDGMVFDALAPIQTSITHGAIDVDPNDVIMVGHLVRQKPGNTKSTNKTFCVASIAINAGSTTAIASLYENTHSGAICDSGSQAFKES